MTDRIKGFVVTLAHDTRTDDATAIVAALRMVKGVADVSASITTIDDHINRQRIYREVRERLLAALPPAFGAGRDAQT